MITIDVVHDLICPWCRIGEHHLDAALSQWKGEAVSVRLHAYQLAPEIPAEGVDYREYLSRKFGGPDALRGAHERLEAVGRPLGITFHSDRIRRLPNTLRGHAMIAAVDERLRIPLLRALQRAYFEEGQDVGSTAVLAKIGESVGLTPEAAHSAAENADLDAARKDAREMLELGVTGVPAFIFDGRYQLVGAQPAEALVRVLDRVVADRRSGVAAAN